MYKKISLFIFLALIVHVPAAHSSFGAAPKLLNVAQIIVPSLVTGFLGYKIGCGNTEDKLCHKLQKRNEIIDAFCRKQAGVLDLQNRDATVIAKAMADFQSKLSH